MWKDNPTNLWGNLHSMYKGIREIDAKVDTSTESIEEFKNYESKIVNDVFVVMATEDGVKRFEKILNLPHYEEDTLQDRKNRILAKLLDRPPINDNTIIRISEQYLGAKVDILRYDNKPYYMELSYRNPNMLQGSVTLKNLLRDIIPANIAFDIIYAFMAWGETKKYTGGEVKTRTWGQLKTEGVR